MESSQDTSQSPLLRLPWSYSTYGSLAFFGFLLNLPWVIFPFFIPVLFGTSTFLQSYPLLSTAIPGTLLSFVTMVKVNQDFFSLREQQFPIDLQKNRYTPASDPRRIHRYYLGYLSAGYIFAFWTIIRLPYGVTGNPAFNLSPLLFFAGFIGSCFLLIYFFVTSREPIT